MELSGSEFMELCEAFCEALCGAAHLPPDSSRRQHSTFNSIL
jgi:hypothetical protein